LSQQASEFQRQHDDTREGEDIVLRGSFLIPPELCFEGTTPHPVDASRLIVLLFGVAVIAVDTGATAWSATSLNESVRACFWLISTRRELK